MSGTTSDSAGAPAATVQRLFAAFRAGDLDALLETVHPESRWTYYGANPRLAAATFSGHDAVRRFFVEDPGDVDAALHEALAHDGPALVNVVVNRQELSLPPTITRQQAGGFGLYLVKAVLSGRADEVIDLARTNVFR